MHDVRQVIHLMGVIQYQLHRAMVHTGLYFGAGGGWKFSRMWTAQAEVVSYDKDELVFSIGLRARF